MGGSSQSKSISEQSAEAYLAQTVFGSCDISCTNIQQNINIDIINTIIGGSITLTQSCAVNANCMIGSTSDATSDVIFKSTNSSNAGNAGSLFSGLLNFDSAESMSRQDIKQTILQNTSQTCKLASLNQMNDITILAANSQIGGGIALGQTGSTQGTCKLQNNLSAASFASAMASNSSQSGKDKKNAKKGGSTILITVIIFIAIFVIVYIIAKIYTSNRDSSIIQEHSQQVMEARGKAGCIGGVKPILDPSGQIVIDTNGRPICPAPNIKSSSPVFNIDVGELIKSSQ